MTGKRRRKNDTTDSDSDSILADSPEQPMDSDSPAHDPRPSPTIPPSSDPRSSLTSDLDPSQTTASGTDPRSSSGHARNTGPASLTEPYLEPSGSFLNIKPNDENVSFRKINIFWPTKQLEAICGTGLLQIETPANGSLIVKTENRAQTKKLLKCTKFCEKEVTVSLNRARNTRQGTIFAPEMRYMSEDEILDGLRPEGVSHVRRLTSFKDGKRRDTSLLCLTFQTTTLPSTLLAGYIRYNVDVYIPNPMRCFKCQRFGHTVKFCNKDARCHKCGEAPHEGSACSSPTKCLSCSSTEHNVSSKDCPTWKKRKRNMYTQSNIKHVISTGTSRSRREDMHSHIENIRTGNQKTNNNSHKWHSNRATSSTPSSQTLDSPQTGHQQLSRRHCGL